MSNKPTAELRAASLCGHCAYGCRIGTHSGNGGFFICDFILITGRRRPCPPGPGCTAFREGKHKRTPYTIFEARAEKEGKA